MIKDVLSRLFSREDTEESQSVNGNKRQDKKEQDKKEQDKKEQDKKEQDKKEQDEVDRESPGTILDNVSYAIFGGFTEYILENTEYKKYTNRIKKPSRFYISRIFTDTIIGFLFFLILATIISGIYLGNLIEPILYLFSILIEILSFIPWIISVAFNSFKTVFLPISDSLVGIKEPLTDIARTLTNIPVIGIVLSIIFSVFVSFLDVTSVLIEELSLSKGVNSPESDAILETLSTIEVSPVVVYYILGLFVFFGTFSVAIYKYYYPIYVSNEVNRYIERNREQAYLFLYAMTKGGLGIGRAIEELGKSDVVYGQTAKIFRDIDQRSRFSSLNLRRSILTETEYLDNPDLKEFLFGIVDNMDTGSDISEYFEKQTQNALERKREKQESFLGLLDIISESYVILIVVFPIFVLVVMIVSGIIGSVFNIIVIELIPYVYVPAGGLIMGSVIYVFGKYDREFIKIPKPKTTYEIRNPKIMEELRKDKTSIMQRVAQNPKYTILLTAPITLFYIISIIDGGIIPFTRSGWNETPIVSTFYAIFVPLLIIFLPWSLFYEWEKRRRRRIEKQLANVLDVIQSSNERGLTLTEALESSASTDKGILYDEIQKVVNKTRVTDRVSRSLIELSNNLRVPRVSQSMYLITRAKVVSGNMSTVLEIISSDLNEIYRIEKSRKSRSRQYAAVIFMALLVGVFLIIAVDILFFEYIISQTGTNLEAASNAGVNVFGNLPEGVFRRVFLHTTMSISIVSGIMIGLMENGNPQNGFKYMLIFTTMSMVGFVIRIILF